MRQYVVIISYDWYIKDLDLISKEFLNQNNPFHSSAVYIINRVIIKSLISHEIFCTKASAVR